MIERDLIAGGDDDLENENNGGSGEDNFDSQNVSNQEINYFKAHNNVPLFSIHNSQMSQTIKVSSAISSATNS